LLTTPSSDPPANVFSF